MDRIKLHVVSCSGCGACCKEIGAPPFMGHEIYDLPDDLRDEVLANRDQEDINKACYWFDAATKTCKNYEHRPLLCQDFEPESRGCLAFRTFHGVDRTHFSDRVALSVRVAHPD